MKRRQMSDEMLFCERCGVSFLWTAEEQRQRDEPGKPGHCPGCQMLLAAPGRERGVVKWYNERKKYGFVTRTTGPEIFAHRSRFDGMGRVQPGDLVEFGVEQGEKGPMAVDVRLLQQPDEKTDK
jgi:cold shock protein